RRRSAHAPGHWYRRRSSLASGLAVPGETFMPHFFQRLVDIREMTALADLDDAEQRADRLLLDGLQHDLLALADEAHLAAGLDAQFTTDVDGHGHLAFRSDIRG